MATIPTRSISDFKSALTGGGARANLFEVNITFPTGINQTIQGNETSFDSNNFNFLCKAAALPASTVGSIDIPFRGRVLKVAGDRTFETWTITVINDESFNHRRSFEAWMQNVAQYADHSGLTNPTSYMARATVYQLGRSKSNQQTATPSSANSRILAGYQFVDIFPTNISAIDLSYETTDSLEEFTVEFQVQYWYPDSGISYQAQ